MCFVSVVEKLNIVLPFVVSTTTFRFQLFPGQRDLNSCEDTSLLFDADWVFESQTLYDPDGTMIRA
jgi:hypothetical protein